MLDLGPLDRPLPSMRFWPLFETVASDVFAPGEQEAGGADAQSSPDQDHDLAVGFIDELR